MTTNSRTAGAHDTVQGMLPWYVNGTLATSDRHFVEEHLDNCSHCRTELDAHRAMRCAVVNDDASPIISIPSPNALISSKATSRARGKRLGGRFLPLAAGIAGAAIAAATLLIVQSEEPGINQQYDTLMSSGVTNGVDLVLEIRFADELTADALQHFLVQLGATEISSTGRQNEFRLTLPDQQASLDHINSLPQRLEEQPGIRSARVVALQLPIQ